MRRTSITALAAGIIALVLVRCGARTPLLVPETFEAGDASDADAGDARDGSKDGNPLFMDLCKDANVSDACEGIGCNIASCGGGQHTILSGKVYDPGGVRPVYGAAVYVPQRALDPISSGPICAQCQAALSGKPLAVAVTDAQGRFTLTDVPDGTIPLVMQAGKWRRKIDVTVTKCTTNTFDQPTVFRLPRNSSEGDMPRIALATGCDHAQCFFTRTIGIDPSEVTGPAGGGHVHVYASPYGDPPNIPNGGEGDPYELWGDLDAMKRYDLLFNACECQAYARQIDPKKPAYTNMKKYLDGGGRMFGTHYHYNWFSDPDGPLDFQKQAPWLGNLAQFAMPPFKIDSSHPRGAAFRDWLAASGALTSNGDINLVDTRNSVAGLNGGAAGHGPYANTTQWIYHPDNYTLYLGFNTPTMSSEQCGRAVFSDVHLSGSYTIGTTKFPLYCGPNGHDTNELALEFLFFDLGSCVQDDTKPPVTPCMK